MWFGFIFIEIISGLMFCNAQTGTSIYGILLSQPGADTDTCGLIGNSQPAEQLNGCPPHIPLTNDEHKIIVAARIYPNEGNNVAALSCNGGCQDHEAESKFSAPAGLSFTMGSVIVNPGCTMVVFSDRNYKGTTKTFESGVHLKIEIKAPLLNCGGGVACANSMLFTCIQVYPVCNPTSAWQTVTTLDNSDSSIESNFSYKKTVGTTFSQAITNSLSVSATVSEAIEASFYDVMKSTTTVSGTLSFDWSELDTETTSNATSYTVDVTLPAGLKVQIQEVVGTCGSSKVHTQMFKVVDPKKNITFGTYQGKMKSYSLV